MANTTDTEAKATNTKAKTGIKKNSIQDNINRMNETVTIKLFKDSGRYSGDVFVRVDGKRYQIKRGIPVQVPRKVADVINQQLKQDQATAQMIEMKETDFNKKSSRLE